MLPAGVRSRFVPDINGLRVHVLEAGAPDRPCVLLLHGFPELAYSWRKIMPPLADAGFHVVAPDLRGYGRTTGWHADYDSEADLRSFRLLNAVRDQLGLVQALELRFGRCRGRARFRLAGGRLVRARAARRVPLGRLMSAPFEGTARISGAFADRRASDMHAAMAKLPRPRKHYQWYYSTRPANDDMWHCRQGVHAFLRAYYHHKSADWRQNKPFRLAGWTAEELAKMPTYYVMDLRRDDAGDGGARNALGGGDRRLPMAARTAELAVYAAEYERNGFGGGLQWYRRGTTGLDTAELQLFAGRTIDAPSMFIAGKSDWGTYQRPGAFERMQETRLHPNAWLPSDPGCRPLGPAGTGRQGQRVAARFPA